MTLEYQIMAAFVLDLVAGDPRWLPHPVKLIGRMALRIEQPLRRAIRNPRTAGVVAVLLLTGTTGSTAWIILQFAYFAHPVAGDVVSILLLYTTFAARDLMRHSYRVYRALAAGDIEKARSSVAMLVGRDTAFLNEEGTVRAAVESVSENLVDGVIAPILFAAAGGPVGALVYKAVSTLDSTFGYMNERYARFGWASARLDDLVNLIPARVTVPLVAVMAALSGLNPIASLRVSLRDGRKHASPNAGLAEAAVAGALGVQLGGINYYDGERHDGPRLGDPLQPLRRYHILAANWVMLGTSVLCLLLSVWVRSALFDLWGEA